MFKLDSGGLLVLNEAVRIAMDKVQKAGNKAVTYREDRATYGVVEKWAYPKQTVPALLGDCEDISLYKRKLLLEAGIPSAVLLMTICLDSNKLGHCVLSVVTNKRDYVLCNAHPEVMLPTAMRSEGYKFLYRQKLGCGIDQPWDVLKI